MSCSFWRFPLLFVSAAWALGCSPFDPEAGRPPPGRTRSFTEVRISARMETFDLLFVIDNSPSMASKREHITRSIVAQVERLTNPLCYSSSGKFLPGEEICPQGYRHEFDAVTNLNIGIITSSLGGHGSASCPDGAEGHHYNDHARLIPTVRAGAPNPSGQGFLTWRRGGDEERQQLLVDLQVQIEAVGSNGCEYPASLEAWYRFLVEPSPPLQIIVNEKGHSAPLRDEGGNIVIDEELLAQREAFLRPRSVVALINVTDKNDCSAMVGQSGFEGDSLGRIALDRGLALPRPPAICAQNPNDACCISCLKPSVAPAHCDLSVCDEPEVVPPEEDPLELRCFDQRRRFGMDFLFPLSRYVDGLRSGEVRDWQSGEMVKNPLLRGAGKYAGQHRSEFFVLYSGILGVPWQDVVSAESRNGFDELDYLDSDDFNWLQYVGADLSLTPRQMLLGVPNLPARSSLCAGGDPGCGAAPVPPYDPFMIESVAARDAGSAHPLTGDLIVPPESNVPTANSINGHESNHEASEAGFNNNELQNACTSFLPEPIVGEAEDPVSECVFEHTRNRAICQPLGGGAAGTTQYGAGAKPSTRILGVMLEMHWAAPDSICASSASGFTPGQGALVQALTRWSYSTGHEECFRHTLGVDQEGMVSCSLLEMTRLQEEYGGPSWEELDCEASGREEVSAKQREVVFGLAREQKLCDGSSGVLCDEFKLCALPQLQGEERQLCLHDWLQAEAHPKPGFCYIDANEPLAGGEDNPRVGGCPPTQRRLLRVVGKAAPRDDSITFLLCQEQELGERDLFNTGGAPQIPPPVESPWPDE